MMPSVNITNTHNNNNYKLIMRLLLSLIVALGLVVSLSCGQDEEPNVTPKLAEIEDKVAEVMDELEVFKQENEELMSKDDQQQEFGRQGELIATDRSSVGSQSNDDENVPAEVAIREPEMSMSSIADDGDLIEDARDNKFTFLSLFHGKYYQNLYEKINHYLMDKLEENDSANDNMNVAQNWLIALESSSPSRDSNLIRAVRQLTALTKIGGENMCSKNAYGILRKNDLATRGRGHKRRTKLGPLRRVDKIVYEYSIRHAIDCFHEYPRKFSLKRAQLDQTQISYVESLFDQIFKTVLRPAKVLGLFTNPSVDKDYDPIEIVRDITSLSRADIGEVTLEKLTFYAKNDPAGKYLDYVNDDRSGKYIINDQKIRDLFEKYIVQPCEYYIEQIGFDILIPMRFDVQMLEPEDRYLLDSDNLIDFYLGYARFRACNLLVFQDRKSLASHVVKAVHRKSTQPKMLKSIS